MFPRSPGMVIPLVTSDEQMMSQDKSQAPVTSKLSWRAGTEGAGAQGHGGGLGAGTHLGHVLGDDVQPALLLYDHAQKLYQVAMPELPGVGWTGWSEPAKPPHQLPAPGQPPHPPPAPTHVMTEASARKACAVASFLMHLTATLFPR